MMSKMASGSPGPQNGPNVSGSITRRQNNVFPATGMSTYYSAGKGGSRISSATSSPVTSTDVSRRRTSGSVSYGSISSTSSPPTAGSPASTVSSVSFSSDASGDSFSREDAMKSGNPKFRTLVKISSDSDRDKLFPADGDRSSREGYVKQSSTHEDIYNIAGNNSRAPPRDAERARAHDTAALCDSPSPGVTARQQTTRTTEPALSEHDTCRNGCGPVTYSPPPRSRDTAEAGNLSSAVRDGPNKVLVREHTQKTDNSKETEKRCTISGLNGTDATRNATRTSYTSEHCRVGGHSNHNNEYTAMALAQGMMGSDLYSDYPVNRNGVSGHAEIDSQVPDMMLMNIGPPLPPRNRKSASYSVMHAPRNHAQANGSTGAPSDLSDSLDSETSSLNNLDTDSAFGFPNHKFHMDQQVPSDCGEAADNGNGSSGDSPGRGGGGEAHPFLVGQRNVLKPEETKETKIISSKGTVRGLKNLVRAGIATFAEKQEGAKNYRQIDKGKVVVYTTSVMIVRETYERCIQVKKILHTHMVKYEERDVFMSRENQRELNERLDTDKQDVPQVFVDGQHIGGFEQVERMNEIGELRTILKQFQRVNRTNSCAQCGGYRYIPCAACHGSKKSQNRNYFIDEFCALRCTNCDENGLVRCEVCDNEEIIAS